MIPSSTGGHNPNGKGGGSESSLSYLSHYPMPTNPLNASSRSGDKNYDKELQRTACEHGEERCREALAHSLQTRDPRGSSEGNLAGSDVSSAKVNAYRQGHANPSKRHSTSGTESTCDGSPEKKRKKEAGFFGHLCANLMRIVTLLMRNPISNLIEFCLPILTVFLAVLFWKAVEMTVHPSPSPVADSASLMSRPWSSVEHPNATTLQDSLPDRGLTSGRADDARPTPPRDEELSERAMLKWLNRLWCDPSEGGPLLGSGLAEGTSSPGKLYFTPDTEDTKKLVSQLEKANTYFREKYGGIINSSTVEDMCTRASGDTSKWGIVWVKRLTVNTFNVSIHLSSATKCKTTHHELKPPLLFTCKHQQKSRAGNPPAQAPPKGEFSNLVKDTLLLFGLTSAVIILFGYFLLALHVTKRIVQDKELQLREMMSIMGMPEIVQYASWLIVYTIECSVMSLIIALIFKFMHLTEASFFFTFETFFLFTMALVAFFALLASFFSSTRFASVVAFLVYAFFMLLAYLLRDTRWMFLSPIYSGMYGIMELLLAEIMVDISGGSDTLGKFYVPYLVLILQFFACVLLMLYFDAVLPKKWGVRKSLLFFIVDPIRACCCRQRRAGQNDNPNDSRYPDGVFEPTREASSYTVRIVGLLKAFRHDGEELIAVKNFHWALREGEVNVLLGQNGSGKSTLMNMMTGMTKISEGDCYIYGHSVRKQLSLVRQGVGYCPQSNILWPDLTCWEHLRFYASLRGLSGAERTTAIEGMLQSVSLEDEGNCLTKHLSGGQKRKLCVIIAFMAGTRLVLLDEPTAGVDALSRRRIWDLTRSVSSQCTVLLSTHLMDEADTLGDSIAVMKKGRLCCAGSSVFLRSHLGVGYALTVPVRPEVDHQPIVDLVSSYEPKAKLHDTAAGELVFELPASARSTFPRLLADIEDYGEELGVAAGYTVTSTTLEQIFVRIAQEESCSNTSDAPVDQKETQVIQCMTQEADVARISSSVWNVGLLHSDFSIMMSQLGVMLGKRLLCTLRYWYLIAFQTVLPILVMLIMAVVHATNKVGTSNKSYDTREAASRQNDVKSDPFPLYISILFALILLFIPSTFVSPIVRERSCKTRHLQKVSGLYPSIYWLSNFIFDLFSYLVTIVSILVIFGFLEEDGYYPPDGSCLLFLFLYGTSSVAMAYAFSFLFNSQSTAQIIMMMLFLVSGIGLQVCLLVLTDMKRTSIASSLSHVFRVFPAYCVVDYSIKFGPTHSIMKPEIQKMIEWERLIICLYLALETVAFLLITFILDNPSLLRRFLCRPRVGSDAFEKEPLDPDVLREQDEVMNSTNRSNDPVRVEHLYKAFGHNKMAVRDLTFGVKPEEVFALLGMDGAGKTTTLAMLCQEFCQTRGRIAICGHDTVADSLQALRCIGYCPQFDAVFGLLTVEEHLWLYAGVRGIAYAARHDAVETLLALCGLTEYCEVRADQLSGGNRRKLSVAIALIGGPRVLLLDEPSAGLDPLARHGLWLVVRAAARHCAVLLTTHHMEEVEALAQRVAIMAKGSLRCIGTKSYLKDKYGSGFQVRVRVEEDTDTSKAAILEFFAQMFPGCTLSESHECYYTYDLLAHTKISSVFRLLEENMYRLSITDYTVSPKTIEQVLMRVNEDVELSEAG